MNEGRVEQIGTPLEVNEKPKVLFIAGFINSPSMKFLPVRLDQSGNQVILWESLLLPLNNFENIVNGDSSVTLVMRPEHLENCETENTLIFLQVELLEKLCEDTVLYGILDQTDTALTVWLSGNHPVDTGDKLPITITPEHLHIFDSDTGNKLN